MVCHSIDDATDVVQMEYPALKVNGEGWQYYHKGQQTVVKIL
jgi:hypothetical protein